MKRVLLALAAVATVAIAAVVIAFNVRPDVRRYADRLVPPDPVPADSARLRVTFAGVSTLLFDDGEASVLIDGFFTRPGLLSMLTEIAPDSATIATALDRLGVHSLAVVIPVHSHYDHAMDAPFVAARTGAVLLGSASTANVGRGAGLPEERIRVVKDGETLTFGRFRVTLIRSAHARTPAPLAGEIEAPLSPPAKATDYKEGGSYSVLIQHGAQSALVHASAGFVPGALRGRRADVVYLGIAALGNQNTEFRESYWREVVQEVGARRVVAIHWDDFFRPLSEPLVPMPRMLDDFDASMRYLVRRGTETGVDVRLASAWARTDPFAGLATDQARSALPQ